MLIIRTEQLEAMSRARRREVAARFERELRRETPARFAGGAAAPGVTVIEAVERGVGYGLTGEAALKAYVALALDHGFDYERDDELRQILSSATRPPRMRVDRARAWIERRRG